jgi:hypothetical protein
MKNILKSKVILYVLIVILFITILGLWLHSENLKYSLLQEKSISQMDLGNYLIFDKNAVASGSITGFVKFDNITNQPRGHKQYYIIQASDVFEPNSPKQVFTYNDLVSMRYLPPKSLGKTILYTKVNDKDFLVLEDKNGSFFTINKRTGDVKIIDSQGDSTSLITSDDEFEKFMMDFLKI